jgi:hypothetical protein
MKTKLIPLFALATASVLALSACSVIQDRVEGAVDDAVEEGVERAIEEGAGDGVDIEVGEDADLPAGFPSEIPLPDAQLTAGVGSPDGWWVTYTSDNPGVLDALYADMESAGWEQTADFTTDDLSQRGYTNGTYDVAVGAVESEGTVQLTISVTPAVAE